MKNRTEITIAQPEDAETLADISKRAFDSDVDHGAPGPGGPDGYDSVDVHRRDAESDRIDYWKFVFNDRIVGGTRVFKVSDEHGYIYGVFVDPDFHGRGIGTETFRLIEGRYPEVKKWTLDTPEWNPRTKGFYEKIGFKQTGILRWVPTFDLRYFVKITDDTYKEEIVPISKLKEGLKGILVEGTVDSISDTREVQSKNGERFQVANAELVDDTGSVKLILWNNFIRQINEGERVYFQTGYVDENQGQLQLNVSRGGTMIILR